MNEQTRPTIAATTGQSVAPIKPIDQVRSQLAKMEPEFRTALPAHIPVERFKRVILTAANQNQDLMLADRLSLMGAAMKAAQDGLLPDGREGALVIFAGKVSWMPMVYGIIKKMRNSGELASIVAHEVYQRDHFKYRLGDEEMIEHEPYLGTDEPGPMIAVYAIAKLKDGTVQREVMTRAQVEKVRNVSKTKNNGPWVQWFEEMARKTVVRRLSKYLPMSTEIEDMLRRDDALSVSGRTPDETPSSLTIDGNIDEDFAETAEVERVEPETHKRTRTGKAEPAPKREEPPPFDPETGEIDRAEPSHQSHMNQEDLF